MLHYSHPFPDSQATQIVDDHEFKAFSFEPGHLLITKTENNNTGSPALMFGKTLKRQRPGRENIILADDDIVEQIFAIDFDTIQQVTSLIKMLQYIKKDMKENAKAKKEALDDIK